ncbi:MAG TPA: carboxymuconolactone decarboxylase family protein [Streptosporangiaceae bacterium]|nr:carboxymuconolactone decarboxylase family protein [Streptosporangiaceae bacterium]
MSRLPDLRRDDLTAAGQAVWDLIVRTRGSHVVTDAGTLSGPFNAFVHAPDAGGPLASLGAALRFGSSLERRLTEVAVITVACHWRAEFEWSAHARIAREAGVPDAVVDAIGRGAEPPFSAADERIVYAATRELVTTGQLADASYEAARGLLGDTGTVELVALCGYYSLVSFVLNAFAVPLPPGVPPMWPRHRED